jgi:LuxR family transcriptional regulator of csgAB operon
MPPDDGGNDIRSSDSAMDAMVHVVGANPFNNEILSDYLAESCGMISSYAAWHGLEAIFDQFPNQIHVIFFDCSGMNKSFLWNGSKIGIALNFPRCLVALFNVEPCQYYEQDALKRGVRGILYRNQPINLFPKAIKVLMKGELWYSRKILADFLMSDSSQTPAVQCMENNLSLRERKILSLLASGISNRTIAETLHLSPHTVKTHIYNIYKKLKVSSRLHAVGWLANKKNGW